MHSTADVVKGILVIAKVSCDVFLQFSVNNSHALLIIIIF